MKKNEQGPIIIDNGEIIDLDKSMIGSTAIMEGMKYISKITEGLATGSLSQDEEYVSFRKKVLADLIIDKSEEVRKKVETEEVSLKGRYSNASEIQSRAVAKIQEQSRKIAEDSGITFYIGDDDDVVYSVGGHVPVGVRGSYGIGSRYKQIDIKKLKELIAERRREVVEVRADGGDPVEIDLDELPTMSELLEKHPEIVAEETAKMKKKKKKKKKKVVKKVEKKFGEAKIEKKVAKKKKVVKKVKKNG